MEDKKRLKRLYKDYAIGYEYNGWEISITGSIKGKSDVYIGIENDKGKYVTYILYGEFEEVMKVFRRKYKKWIKDLEKEEIKK